MNAFLQSMLGKSTEEITYNSAKSSLQSINTVGIDHAKPSWIKKLGNNSPKYRAASSPKFSISSIESSMSEVPGKVPVMFHPPAQMADLETIIREFENNFLSPSKVDASNNSSKEGNFVKKIVAAFEDKYKAYNESRIEEDVKTVLKNRKLSASAIDERSQSRFSLQSDSPKKKPSIFGSSPKIFKESHEKEEAKVSMSFDSPREKQYGQKNTWISIFSSPFKYGASKENKLSQMFSNTSKSDHSTPKGRKGGMNERSSSLDLLEDDDDFPRRFDRVSSPFKTSDDETKSVQSLDLSLTLDLEDSTLLDVGVSSLDDSITIVCSEREDAKLPEEKIETSSSESLSKGTRKTPKIIGAFLKRPIEVEKTAIDWIPITGKKLPRKRSLKKLLSMLTRKKSSDKRAEKVFLSQRNVNEEPRELQDSGYDEKSSSNSSLKSLGSISEVLSRPDRFETRRKASKMKTFQTRNSLNRVNDEEHGDDDDDEDEDEESCEEEYRAKVTAHRKLRLIEVPRESLGKDLGPCYPSSFAVMTMSLDRRSISKSAIGCSRHAPLSRAPRHPYLSRIPKHPFVSMTKMDEIPSVESPPIVSSLTDINDTQKSFQPSKQPKKENYERTYDVPRRYFSKSESKIHELESEKKTRNDEPIYDMPKAQPIPRPTSSIYEDALSLKRRLDYLPTSTIPNFYSVSDDEEPHYATIRRGNRRVPSNQQIPRSCNDLRSSELHTSL